MAQNVVLCLLKRGGKSAAIVHEYAGLEVFENDIRWGIYFDAGQVCSAMARIILHESRADELIEHPVSVARSLSTGPGIDRPEFGDNMGAMVSEGQRDRAAEMVSKAQSQGARLTCGGPALNIPSASLEPTDLADVTPDTTIAQHEVFGPALTVLTVRDGAQAIEIVNGTGYDLVGGVLARDLDRPTAAARPIRAGQVLVNEWYAAGVPPL